jgi:hypothetical protein
LIKLAHAAKTIVVSSTEFTEKVEEYFQADALLRVLGDLGGFVFREFALVGANKR